MKQQNQVQPEKAPELEHDDRSLMLAVAERETRALINQAGVEALVVDDLTKDDLPLLAWSGGPTHVDSMATALERVESGEVDYLAVRAPNGLPVAKGGIDYKVHEGAGMLWQLATYGGLQSLGVGGRLIAEAEKRIKQRGLRFAMMGVEDDNQRARALYEKLGYKACGHEQESWEEADADGKRYIHYAEVTLLKKDL